MQKSKIKYKYNVTPSIYTISNMGVKKLLNVIQPAIHKEHLSSFPQRTAALDISIYISRANYRHAQDMRDTGNVEAFLPYIHHLLDLLQHYNITPICVFDGRSAPAKKKTISKRVQEKQKNQQKGFQLKELIEQDMELLDRYQLMREEQRFRVGNELMGTFEYQSRHIQTEEISVGTVSITPLNPFIQIIEEDDQIIQEAVEPAIQIVQKDPVVKQVVDSERENTLIQKTDQVQKVQSYVQSKPFAVSKKTLEQMLKIRQQRTVLQKEVKALHSRIEQGDRMLNRAVFLSEEIILATMRCLKARNIQFMVAPYQAEWQIAQLYREKKVSLAISEDSDLVIYQVPTLCKLNWGNGECEFIDLKNSKNQVYEPAHLKSFINMSRSKKVEAAVLMGTDYIDNLKGVGPVKAIKLAAKSLNLESCIDNISSNPIISQHMPPNYEQQALEAYQVMMLGMCYKESSKSLQFLDMTPQEQAFFARYDVQDLYRLVGPYYEYDEQVKSGLKNARSLKKRTIQPLPRTTQKQLNLELMELAEKQIARHKLSIIKEKRGGHLDIRSFVKPKKQPKTSETELTPKKEQPSKQFEQQH